MRILLAGVTGLLHDNLAQALATQHDVKTFEGDTRSLDDCNAAADCDVLIHALPDADDALLRLDCASRGTWNLLTTTRATRYILLSSMRLFEQYDPGWRVDESWAARPGANADDLVPYLAEVASREISRVRPVECAVLRLDEVVDETPEPTGGMSRWLHLDDAVDAVTRAVTTDQLSRDGARWNAFNIARGGPGSRFPGGNAATEILGFTARHQGEAQAIPAMGIPAFPPSPSPLADLPEPERILLLGAGGPLGAVARTALASSHTLRLTDVRSMAEAAAAPPQSEGAPLPSPATPPHEERLVDVTDATAVREAVQGMDAIINCTVMRHDPVEAFRVNTLGAFNVMQAAVEAGIRRVVHTGPVLTLGTHPAGYIEDRDVGADVPPRPGDNLYFVSKFLGQEICRVFAEQHGIAVPTLLYGGFVDPAVARRTKRKAGAYTISWEDSGRSLAAAVNVPNLPAPFVVAHILVEAPHDRYRSDSARRVLGWEPQDRLDELWYRDGVDASM